MTLTEADEILNIWGKYIENINGKLMRLFSPIPEFLLPFPKDVLSEALNICAKRYHEEGNHKAVESIQTAASVLMFYAADDEAISKAGGKFSNPAWRKAFLPSLKKSQSTWGL